MFVSDGELAHAVAILIGVRVFPEVVFQFVILRVRLGKPVVLYVHGQGMLPQNCQTSRIDSPPTTPSITNVPILLRPVS
jgi:hypothetical protein